MKPNVSHRILAVLLTICLTVSMAACGGGANSASSSAPAPASTPASDGSGAAPAAEPITIEYWNINDESFGGPAVQSLVDKFNATNDKNITVNNRLITGSYTGVIQNLQAALVADNYPGVVQISYSYLNYFAENFPYVSPQEIVTKYCPDDSEWINMNFLDSVSGLANTTNGDMLALPYAVSQPILFVNKDMLAKAGIDPETVPATWDDVLDICAKIKAATGDYGIYIESGDNIFWQLGMVLSAGAEMYEMENGKCVPKFNSEEGKVGWQVLQDLYTNNYTVSMTVEEGLAAFISGKIAIIGVSTARAAYFTENCDFALTSWECPGYDGHETRTATGGNMLVTVAKDEAQIKACWEFLKFLYQPENLKVFIEATGYLPPIVGMEDELTDFINNAVGIQTGIDSLKHATAWTSWPGPNGLEVEQIMYNMRDSITAGADISTALSDAEAKVKALMDY